MLPCLLIAALAAAATPGAVIEPARKSGAYDLAAPWALAIPKGALPLATSTLDADAAKKVLDAPPLTMDSPGQLRMLEDPKAGRVAEAKRLAQEASARRENDTLWITAFGGKRVRFLDRHLPGTKNADPDGETYIYAGRLGSGKLHRVQVSFEHDSPGSYLVHPGSGRSLFVHEGSDTVVPSPGGERLVLFNDLNGPLTLVVVSLGGDGPAIEVLCRAPGDAPSRIDAKLKGWRDAGTLDLVISGTPLRLERGAGAWSVKGGGAAPVSCVAWPAPGR